MLSLNMSGHGSNEVLKRLGFIDLSINVADINMTNIDDFLADLIEPLLPEGVGQIKVIMPGSAVLSRMVIPIIEGLTGCYPVVVTLQKNGDGIFVPSMEHDFDKFRKKARTRRRGMKNI